MSDILVDRNGRRLRAGDRVRVVSDQPEGGAPGEPGTLLQVPPGHWLVLFDREVGWPHSDSGCRRWWFVSPNMLEKGEP